MAQKRFKDISEGISSSRSITFPDFQFLLDALVQPFYDELEWKTPEPNLKAEENRAMLSAVGHAVLAQLIMNGEELVSLCDGHLLQMLEGLDLNSGTEPSDGKQLYEMAAQVFAYLSTVFQVAPEHSGAYFEGQVDNPLPKLILLGIESFAAQETLDEDNYWVCARAFAEMVASSAGQKQSAPLWELGDGVVEGWVDLCAAFDVESISPLQLHVRALAVLAFTKRTTHESLDEKGQDLNEELAALSLTQDATLIDTIKTTFQLALNLFKIDANPFKTESAPQSRSLSRVPSLVEDHEDYAHYSQIAVPLFEALSLLAFKGQSVLDDIAGEPLIMDVLLSTVSALATTDDNILPMTRVLISVSIAHTLYLLALPSHRVEDPSDEAQLQRLVRAAQGKSLHQDDSARVQRRQDVLMKHDGLIPSLKSMSASTSLRVRCYAAQVFLFLVVNKGHRPKVLQQGGSRALLLMGHDDLTPAMQALAKLLITASPAIVFNKPLLSDAAESLARMIMRDEPPAVSEVMTRWSKNAQAASIVKNQQPISASLLAPQGPWPMVQFECILALTNIASVDEDVVDYVLQMRTSSSTGQESSLMKRIFELMSSPNQMLQCAATELCCNLSMSPTGYSYITAGTIRNPSPSESYTLPEPLGEQLYLLVALSCIDHMSTRLAASGALAILSQQELIADALVCSPFALGVISHLVLDSQTCDPEFAEPLLMRGLEVFSYVMPLAVKAHVSVPYKKRVAAVLTHCPDLEEYVQIENLLEKVDEA